MKKLLITLLVLVLAAALLFGLYYFLWTPENFAALGARAMRAGNYSRAVSRYSTAVELDPDNAEYVIALADACVADGSYTMAERTLVSALRIAPSTELYLKLSATYVAQDKLLDAQQMLDNINNAAIRAEIDAMRPAAPALTPEGGEFSEYITVTVAHADGPAYVSLDKQYPSLASGPCTEPVALPAGATHLSAVVVGENGLVSPLTEADYLIVGVIEEVTFQDSALEACVREQLSLPEGTRIMTSDLWTVTELTVPEEVSDYSDLRHFIHLKSLTIHGSSVEDYSFLSSLTELETLDLSGSLVSAETLGYIGALPKLNALTLSGCGLSNILPLADAETITVLDLSDNSISDIGALSAFTGLTHANLNRNAIASLEPLRGLSALQELNAAENKLTSLDPLSACKQLKILDISSNAVTSIAPLAPMRELVALSAGGNALTDASGLAGCISLERLDLSNNQLTNVDAIKNLTNLTRLDFSRNSVAQIPDLSGAAKLQQFYASYNSELADISSLAGLAALNYVDVDYTDVAEIEFLKDCPNLVQINAFGTKVTNAKTLTDMGIIVRYDPTGTAGNDN